MATIRPGALVHVYISSHGLWPVMLKAQDVFGTTVELFPLGTEKLAIVNEESIRPFKEVTSRESVKQVLMAHGTS